MPLWGLSGWSDSVNKRMCRFLIHRYLGHLLKEKLSLEQLSVDLYKGTGTIQDVNVDVQYVNEILETLKVPIRLVDGYIGEITAAVPWAQLLNDSCLMEIKRLEVTIQPLKAFKLADLQSDLVSSMIESVMGSLASSMELAKSFLNDTQGAEETEHEAEEGGVEAFAQIIDAVMSRMRIVFSDTVVRLENPPRPDSTLSSAIELQIDRIEFLDEQLEVCEQQGTSKDTITTQPHSLYAIPDLNKILHLQGVRLYTDVFSRPEASDFPSMSGSAQVFTSMYIRRQEKAQKKSSSVSPPSPMDEMAQSSASTTNFQSCYSHMGGSILPAALADDLDSLSMTQSNSMPGGADAAGKLPSDPIQFAAFTGEKQTIRLRLRNNALSPSPDRCVNNKVDVQMFLGGLAVFLTPSQLIILQSVIEKLLLPSTDNSHADPKKCGKPMKQTDFARVEHQLQGDLEAKALWRTDFSSGNWSGEEKFFDTSRKPTLGNLSQPPVSDMSSVILDSNGPSIGNEQLNMDNELRKTSRGSLSPRSPSHDVKPEVTHIKARLSNFWLTLTHKDPMSSGSGASDLSASVETIRAWSDHFFQSSSAVNYSARTTLKDIRSACDAACSLDQLRFIGCPLVFDYTIERGFNAESVVMNISAANCEFLECLSASSVEAAESDGMTYVELATFAAHSPDDGWNAEEMPNFCLRLANRDGLPHYNISLELSPCRTQLDPSMVDRICQLTHCRPAFLSSGGGTSTSQRTVVASTASVSSLELKEDLFVTAVTSKNAGDTASTVEVDLRCADWTIELNIPIADLRDHTAALSRPPWWVRRVRDESLVLQLKNARVKLPKFDPSVMDAQGMVKITCAKAIGSLIGDPEVLHCDSSAQQFLFASGLKDSLCSVSLKWDLRNKSLRAEQNASPDGDMATSSWGSYFRMPSSGTDGPFSRKVVMHENEELTIVGSRPEMSEFGRKCLQNTDLCVEIDVPILRLQLPSKQFYEIIYNRLVNDIALWEPSSPAYRASQPSQTNFDIHVAGLGDGDSRFQPCRSTAGHRDSDEEESDDESVRTLQEKTRGPSRRTTANKFCLLLNTASARILVGASCLEDNIISGSSELAIEAGSGELFVVTGYQGDPNVVYFFVSLGLARLWHQNLLDPSARPYANDVTAEHFAKATKGDLKAEPTPENVALCKLVDDDNVAVALRIVLRPKDNSKDILAAIGIRNTTVHMHPFADPGHFWITQLIDFFDVPDYPIAGYELPKITTELHVHATSSTVSYDHAYIKPGSPLKLRLVLGSCDVSSRIVQQFAVMKLQCLFEEVKLYMCGKPERERHVNFDRQPAQPTLTVDDFVCLMRMGLFDLEVTVAQEMMLNDEQKASMPDRKQNEDTPMMEIKCRNDLLKIWTCADSLAMLINAAIEIAESGLVAKPVQKTEEQAPPPRPELTPLVEHQLEQMVKSAMLHTVGSRSDIVSAESASDPSSARSSDSIGREALLAAAIEEALHRPQERINSAGSDEDFCIVDEIPGSGIMLPSGEPRIRKLSDSGIDIAENHFMAPQQRSNPLTKLPHGYPQPLIRYLMRDFSVLLHIYGGADFANACEAKTYSVSESRQGKGQGQRVEADAQGGPNRDHSVLVEVQLTKVCFLFEMFGGNAPALARHLLTVQDAEVRDRLTASQINKMLYQYASGQRPRRTCAPMLALRLLETHNGEGKVKISLLPLRLNFDQDTLEFIQDFGTELSAGIQLPVKNKTATTVSSEPIMEVPNHLAESEPLPPSAPPAEPELPVPVPPSMEDSVNTLAGLFAEEEPAPVIADSVDLFSDYAPSSGGVRFVKSPSSEREWPPELKSSSSSSNAIVKSQSGTSISTPSPAGGETFFKHFSFSPSVTIRLDYQGKRVKTDQGALLGLLIGLSQLHCTELHLKELHNRQGLLGLGRCVQYALNEWVVDIRRNQLPQVVGSYGPISSLVQIAQGIRDLFLMPVDEYRKTDGHVVKGIQRGAESFGVSTAAAAVEITQRMVGVVQGVAEFAFDIVAPEYPPPPARRRQALLALVKQPNDFREGLHMAYDAVREGVVDAAEVLHLAAQEDRAQGRWPLRGLLRQATPTVLRPIVVASRATGHVLGGLRSQLRPDTHREELDKWRQST